MNRKMLMASAMLSLVAVSAMANPIQIGNSGSASQVYGDGSAASSSSVGNTTGIGIGGAGGAGGRGGAGGSATVGNVSGGKSTATVGNVTGGKATGGKASVNVTIDNTTPQNAANKPATAGNADTGNGNGNASGSRHAATSHANSGQGGYVYSGGTPNIPVATAVAPAIMSFNPCSGSSASAGLQGASFGLSFGTGGGFDNACRLHMLGQDAAAVAYLCRANGDIRQAFKDIGQPCPVDRPQVVAVAARAPTVTDDRPDYCFTASAGEVRQHAECVKHN